MNKYLKGFLWLVVIAIAAYAVWYYGFRNKNTVVVANGNLLSDVPNTSTTRVVTTY